MISTTCLSFLTIECVEAPLPAFGVSDLHAMTGKLVLTNQPRQHTCYHGSVMDNLVWRPYMRASSWRLAEYKAVLECVYSVWHSLKALC